MVQLTFNIAAFALWLLEAILWSLAAIAGWAGLAIATVVFLIVALRRWRRQRLR